MAQRLWEQVQRPEWAKAQAERLDEGYFSQMRSHEEWLQQEQERQSSWPQEWKQSWAWDWASHRWTWGSGGFWVGRTRLVVTGAYRPGLPKNGCKQLGRG